MKLDDYYNKIGIHRYGRLISKSKCLSWEAYQWCMLPIFYKHKKLDDKLIKLLVKYYYRGKIYNEVSFNQFKFSNEFIKIMNDLYNNSIKVDYYSRFEKHLQNIAVSELKLNKDNLIDYIQEYEFKYSKFATYLLCFLETCETTDINIVSTELTLEHIYPQKYKQKLSNPNLIYKIGNLTLLECKNSENGHKGNSSLGCKDYTIKKKSYCNSHSHLTRNIPIEYDTDIFAENEIKKRTKELAIKIEKHTNYLQ